MIEGPRVWIFPAGVTPRDLAWGAVGAVAGAMLFVLLWPLEPLQSGGKLVGDQVYSWLLGLLAFGGLGFFTAVLSLLDVREHRLPNGLLIWGNTWVLLLLSFASFASGDLRQLVVAWACAAAFGFFMFLLWMRRKPKLGAGDVKLVPMAAFAAVWGASGQELISAVFTFPFLMSAGTLLFMIIALIHQRREFAAAPIILGASWFTIVTHSEALGQLLNR